MNPVSPDDSAASTFGELMAAARGNGSERWRAIAELGKLPSVEALEALVEMAGSTDWTIRRAAIESLGQHPLAPARAAGLLGAALHDPSPYVVHGACSAIGAAKLTGLRRDVTALLQSPNAATRGAALRALDALWDAGLTQPVMDIHRGDPDDHLRRVAAFMLYGHASAEWWPELVEMWRADPLARHRVWACELAALSDSAELRASVLALVSDADGHVRKAALAVSGASR